MLQEQDSACAICGLSPDEALVVDHCHVTGKVRSLCCKNCNTGLGMLRDNAAAMRRAAEYMEAHQPA